MGATHGAEELHLCSHGLACQAGAWVMMMKMVLFCLSKRTPLLNGLGFSGTSY
jgi:hypothetical protein